MILGILMNLMIVGWEMDRMKRMRMRQKLKQKEKFHKRNSLNHYVDKLSIEVRIPTKLMGPSSHKARRFNKPTRRGGGGNSPSPSPPPSRGGHERRKRKIPKRPRWVYMVQGPPGPPGQDRDGRDGANAPPVPAPHVKFQVLLPIWTPLL